MCIRDEISTQISAEAELLLMLVLERDNGLLCSSRSTRMYVGRRR